jgi:hypothetical protein
MRWLTTRRNFEQAMTLVHQATESAKAALAMVDRLQAENNTLREAIRGVIGLKVLSCPEPPAADLAAMEPITPRLQ